MDPSRRQFLFAFLCASLTAVAQSNPPCTRFAAGSAISAPQDLHSSGGVLSVNLFYQTTVDQSGNPLFCFTTPDGSQSPTLHINPGDLWS